MKSAQEERTKKRNEVNTRVMTDLRRATRVFFFFSFGETKGNPRALRRYSVY